MIGQSHLLEKLRKSKARSILITGPPHFGKKTLVREFLSNEESVYEITGNANTFREALERVYTTSRPTVYIIPDLDKKHPTVQNMLLKVIEEPPLSSRFILTASSSVLPTINSRCVTYTIEPYSADELSQIQTSIPNLGKSPGQINLINAYSNLGNLYQSLTDLVDNLKANRITLAKALKIFKDINRCWVSDGIPQELFIWVMEALIGETPSRALDWLRQQPEDSTRYVRVQFIMKYWLEQQEMM